MKFCQLPFQLEHKANILGPKLSKDAATNFVHLQDESSPQFFQLKSSLKKLLKMKICSVLAVLPFRSLLCLCKMKFHISRAEVCLNCSKNKAPIIFGINFFYKPALTRFMLCVFAIETKRKHWDGIFALFFCSSCDSYVKNKLFESLLIYLIYLILPSYMSGWNVVQHFL